VKRAKSRVSVEAVQYRKGQSQFTVFDVPAKTIATHQVLEPSLLRKQMSVPRSFASRHSTPYDSPFRNVCESPTTSPALGEPLRIHVRCA